MIFIRDIPVKEPVFYEYCDAIEFIYNTWGHFWVDIEDKFSLSVSDSYQGRRWIKTLNKDGSEGEMIFGNCITPGITKEDYDSYVKVRGNKYV